MNKYLLLFCTLFLFNHLSAQVPPTPWFVNPPGDTTLNCIDLDDYLANLTVLAYTNDAAPDSLISGTVGFDVVDDWTLCGGFVTVTWDTLLMIGGDAFELSHTQTIEVSGPQLVDPPMDMSILCSEVADFLGNVPTSILYSNLDTGACELDILISLDTIIESWDECGGTIVVIWSDSTDCDFLSHTQTVFVTGPTILNPPADVTLTCSEVAAFLDNVTNLSYSNQDTTACGLSAVLEPVISENWNQCEGGTIVITWGDTSVCEQLSHTQTITIPGAEFDMQPEDLTLTCSEVAAFLLNVPNLNYSNQDTSSCGLASTLEPVIVEDWNQCEGGTISITWNDTSVCSNIIYVQTVTVSGIEYSYTPAPEITISCFEVEGFLTDNVPVITYSNSATTACGVSGEMNPEVVEDWTICAGGTITVSWNDTTTDCGILTFTQTITVEPIEQPQLVSPPADVTISCINALTFPSTVQALQFSNGVPGGSCSISGQISNPTITEDWTSCAGGTITVNWATITDCDIALSHTQIVTVLPTSTPEFTNVPDSIIISCADASTFASTVGSLDYANNAPPGDCFIAGSATPTIVEDWTFCDGGTISVTWEAETDCGYELNATQFVTVLPAATPVFPGGPANSTVACSQVPDFLAGIANLNYTNNAPSGGCLITGTATPSIVEDWADCEGTITITWSDITEDCSIEVQHVQVVTVIKPPLPPTPWFVNPPGDTTLTCAEVVNYLDSLTDLLYTNNAECDDHITGTTGYEIVEDWSVCGGTITVTWDTILEFDDGSIEISYTQTITVLGPEVVNPPVDTIMNCSDLTAYLNNIPPLVFSGTGTPDCEIEITVLPSVVENWDECGGSVTITWSDQNGVCGDSISFTQVITVVAPEFSQLPQDTAISCSQVASFIANVPGLTYTNEGTGACAINETITPVIVEDWDNCGGIITITWSTQNAVCGGIQSHVQLVEVFAPEFTFLPADTIMTCSEFNAYFDSLPVLSYTNQDVSACSISGDVVPVVAGEIDDCEGGIITITWQDTSINCPGGIIHIQTVTVLPQGIPFFADLPEDKTILCEETLGLPDYPPLYSPISYSNGEIGGCEVSGIANPQVENDFTLCEGGTITVTWEIPTVCDSVISHIQIITVQPPLVPGVILPPQNKTISCNEAINFASTVQPIEFYNGEEDVPCAISGTISPTLSENWNFCEGGSIIVTWSAVTSCGYEITHIQNVTVSPAADVVFQNAPVSTGISCDAIPLILANVPDLNYSNNQAGGCGISGVATPTVVEDWFDCEGTITITWTDTATNCGTIVEHVQVLTIQEASLNDDCINAVTMQLDVCSAPNEFTTIASTPSVINTNPAFNDPTCWNDYDGDVWFLFFSPLAWPEDFDALEIVVYGDDSIGNNILNPQVALYRVLGFPCGMNNLLELDCEASQPGENFVSMIVEETALQIGTAYYVRVAAQSLGGLVSDGDFGLCIRTYTDPIGTDCDNTYPIDIYDLPFTHNGSTELTGDNYSISPCGNNTYLQSNEFVYSFEVTDSVCVEIDITNSDNNTGVFVFRGCPGTSGAVCVANYGVPGGNPTLGYVTMYVPGEYFIFVSSTTATPFTDFTITITELECGLEPLPLEVECIEDGVELATHLAKDPSVISNVFFDCPSCAAGIFSTPGISNMEIKEGVVMTSGFVSHVPGPNTGTVSGNNQFPGDPDLTALIAPIQSRDACILEFDVYAHTNKLSFNYVFGSEEYPVYSSPNSSFNDVFAFFISGPGIDGLQNMALIPNIDIPGYPVDSLIEMSITTVSQYQNSAYWVNNMAPGFWTGGTPGIPPGPLAGPLAGPAVEYNGFSIKFAAEREVIPCQTYRLKLGIADGSDRILDSGVFIEANSLETGFGQFFVDFDYPQIDYMLAGCTDGTLVISLPEPAEDTLYYGLDFSCGTAINGVHYECLENTVTFYPGDVQVDIPFITIAPDDLEDCWEGALEVCIVILQDSTLSENSNCDGPIDTIRFGIECGFELEVLQDSFITCVGSSVQFNVSGALEYEWSLAGTMDDHTIPNPTVLPTFSTWYYVNGTIGNCTITDSIYVEVVDPQLTIANPTPLWICRYDSVQLNAFSMLPDAEIFWTPNLAISDTSIYNPIVYPLTTTTYTLTLSYEHCVETASVTVNVDPFEIPNVVPDDTICQGSSIQLATISVPSISIYSWTPTTGLNNPSIPNPIATPSETTTYQLITTSPITQTCKDTQYVTIHVIPIFLDVDDETLFICKGDSVQLNAVTNPGGEPFLSWTPSASLICNTPCTNPIVFPSVTTTYTANLVLGNCAVSQQVTVRVDSIPPINMINDVYLCSSNLPSLNILSYTVLTPSGGYPDISFQWTPGPGDPCFNYISSTPTNNNIIVMVTCAGTGQFQFIKETTNNACFRSDTVNIFVEEPAQVDIMQNDTSICVGGEVQLNATSSQADPTFSWTPAAGLSCTNCPDPIASPENTTTYTVTSGTGNCQGQNTITIEVGNPQFDLIPDSLVCIGDEVQLGLVHDPNTTYTWTASSGETVPAVGDPTVSPTENTLYILNASMGGCEFADSVFITVNEYPEVDLTANAVEFCSGETIELSAATISGVTIVWTGQNMNTSVGPNITANTPNPGTFTYTVTVDNGGCITQESIQVTVFANPILDLNDDAVICPGQSVLLGNVDDPNTTYTWTTSTGVTVPPIGNPEVNPFETTTYTVTATIASCEIVESITVIVNPLSINAGEDEFICSSQSVDLLAVGEGGNTYSWAPAEGLSCTDCPNPVATPTETTTYVVTYSLDGECAITDSVTVEVGSNLLVEILPDTIINQGAQVQLSSTVTATDGSIIGDLTYSWDPTNGLSCTDCPNPIANPFESTSYTLSVVSEFGCVGVSNTINIVIDLPLYALPNAFTPDGDDLNDRFRLMISDGAQITIRNFRVFNRWGKLIYDNPSDLGWDGRYEGELVPQDVYIYIIELQRADGTVEILKGDVTLLR